MTDKYARIGLGLFGAGFMGKTRIVGFATAQRAFDFPYLIHSHEIQNSS